MEDFYVDGAPHPLDYLEHAQDLCELKKLLYGELQMSMNFRLLNVDELKQYGINIDQTKITKLTNIYTQYFDKSVKPCKALIIVNSEYNDEGYNNKVSRVVFYDENDNELIPLKGQSRKFHSKTDWYDIDICEDSENEIEDQIVFMNPPALYVRE